MRATPEVVRGSGGVQTRPESAVSTGKGKAPTGGPHLSVAGRKGKGGRLGWAGEREWAGAWRFWAAGKEEKGEKNGPAGLKSRGGKRKAFLFLKGFKHIQFKFEFKNSNSN